MRPHKSTSGTAFRSGTGHAARTEPPARTGPPEQPARPARPDGGTPHEATTVERGAFSHASCACGWRGPARRSRDRARADATAHGGTA
ncbi:hypothetical protein D7M15_12540 [Streptomyces sp. Z26]|nr:hypothetical protein D7M15_12540 [Streptomyces sp. Z26]